VIQYYINISEREFKVWFHSPMYTRYDISQSKVTLCVTDDESQSLVV